MLCVLLSACSNACARILWWSCVIFSSYAWWLFLATLVKWLELPVPCCSMWESETVTGRAWKPRSALSEEPLRKRRLGLSSRRSGSAHHAAQRFFLFYAYEKKKKTGRELRRKLHFDKTDPLVNVCTHECFAAGLNFCCHLANTLVLHRFPQTCYAFFIILVILSYHVQENGPLFSCIYFN